MDKNWTCLSKICLFRFKRPTTIFASLLLKGVGKAKAGIMYVHDTTRPRTLIDFNNLKEKPITKTGVASWNSNYHQLGTQRQKAIKAIKRRIMVTTKQNKMTKPFHLHSLSLFLSIVFPLSFIYPIELSSLVGITLTLHVAGPGFKSRHVWMWNFERWLIISRDVTLHKKQIRMNTWVRITKNLGPWCFENNIHIGLVHPIYEWLQRPCFA